MDPAAQAKLTMPSHSLPETEPRPWQVPSAVTEVVLQLVLQAGLGRGQQSRLGVGMAAAAVTR